MASLKLPIVDVGNEGAEFWIGDDHRHGAEDIDAIVIRPGALCAVDTFEDWVLAPGADVFLFGDDFAERTEKVDGVFH